MPIDRALTLRNAEKLIRQGKLDAGIAEYLRIVEDTPGDWNAKNTLGDLYARAGQTEKAIEQFTEIADNLSEEGSSAKAGAIFKKILKLKPDHERALLQVAEILANQKLYADARTHLNTLIELRKGKGDTRGALHAKVRLGSLDPEDYDARLEAARARVEMGDKAGALRDLKEIAAELAADKGRQAQAIDVLREAATLNPDDDEVKEQLFDIYLAGGELPRAREHARTVDQFRSVASAFEAQGNTGRSARNPSERGGAERRRHRAEGGAGARVRRQGRPGNRRAVPDGRDRGRRSGPVADGRRHQAARGSGVG